MEGVDREIEWLATDESGPAATTVVERSTSRRGLAYGAGLLVVLVVLVVLTRSDDPPEAAAPTTTAPTTTPAESRPTARIVGDGTEVPAGAVRDLTALAGLGLPLEMVVTSPTSDEARLVSVVSADEVRVASLPRLSDLSFDASGRWIAGVSYTRHGEQRRVLWAGEVGGELEPVAVGIRSYAWHDEDGSTIAWTEHGNSVLTSFVLEGAADTIGVELPASGILQGWGHWGYALQSSGAIFSTTIVNPEAELVTLDHPGRFAAFLPGRGALVSGGLAAPTLIDTETGESSPMPGVASDDFVWSVAATDDTEHLLVVPGLRGAPGPGTVLTLDGPVVTEVAMTPTVTDLVLTPDGDGLVLVNQEPADGLAGTIAIVSQDGGRREIRVPDLFPGREWVLTMTGHAGMTG
ncbi:MAG: hypothetical protein AAGA99_21365 [Actinomycetota bacterium]